LKSNGTNLGAGTFAELCRDLEERARAGALENAAPLVEEIHAEYGRVAAALSANGPVLEERSR
jgi:hypothetical protein